MIGDKRAPIAVSLALSGKKKYKICGDLKIGELAGSEEPLRRRIGNPGSNGSSGQAELYELGGFRRRLNDSLRCCSNCPVGDAARIPCDAAFSSSSYCFRGDLCAIALHENASYQHGQNWGLLYGITLSGVFPCLSSEFV